MTVDSRAARDLRLIRRLTAAGDVEALRAFERRRFGAAEMSLSLARRTKLKPSAAAIVLVQQKGFYNNNALVNTYTLNSAVTPGSTVLLAIAYDPVAGNAPSVSGLGATWSQVVAPAVIFGGATSLTLWKGVGCTGGSAITMTLTVGAGAWNDAHASEWSGVTTVTSGGSAGQTNSAAPVSPALALTAGVVGYSAIGWQNNPTKSGADTPSAWTSMGFNYDASFGIALDSAYRIAAGSETAQRAWSLGSAQWWNGLSAKLS